MNLTSIKPIFENPVNIIINGLYYENTQFTLKNMKDEVAYSAPVYPDYVSKPFFIEPNHILILEITTDIPIGSIYIIVVDHNQKFILQISCKAHLIKTRKDLFIYGLEVNNYQLEK